MTMEQSPRHGVPLDPNAGADQTKRSTGDAEVSHVSGFAEAPSAFLPGPWVDLGQQSIPNEPDTSLQKGKQVVEELLRDAGLTPSSKRLRVGAIVPRVTGQHAPVREHPASSGALAAKRAVDVIGSIVALILFAPLMGMIAFALWCEGGPILYRQTRIGRGRLRFQCLKFRSMRRNADRHLQSLLARDAKAREEWNRHQKLCNDPRVTPFGRLLRSSSLDELPQLINVLKGEMSLVGPRPIVAPEVPGYTGDRAYFESAAFADYAACLPGITGLWQISGRHQTAYLDRIRLDRQYVRTWSLWLDLKILLLTTSVVVSGSGR